MRKVLAVDMGATGTAVGLIEENLQIKHKSDFPTEGSPREIIEKIKDRLDRIDPRRKMAAGISLCGLLSPDGSKLLRAPNLSWEDISLAELFKPLGRSFRVLNDGSAAAWASYNIEKEPSTTRLISMTLGTGVGGGIIADGRILKGAAELGHVKTDPRGALCGCGSRGCLETVAGGAFIPDRAAEWENLNVKSPRELFNLASGGNKKALAVWDKIGFLLGYYLGGVVNMTGAQEIIIGGNIARASRFFMGSLEKELKKSVMASEHKKCLVKISGFKNNMSLVGAGALFLIPQKK